MSVKINALEIEGIKRIKAVSIVPNEDGLTIIGGKNGAGKTSVLDAIAWALGGDRFKPSNYKNKDTNGEAHLFVKLSNGITVERGDNGTLKVTDAEGKKSGQTLLNSFIDELALNLPHFMNSNNSDKAKTLLKILGIGEKLAEFDEKEKTLYDERHAIGVISTQKKKYALELPMYEGVPDEEISVADLIKQQQDILAKNAKNASYRAALSELKSKKSALDEMIKLQQDRIREATEKLETMLKESAEVSECIGRGENACKDLTDESAAEIEESIKDITDINAKVRSNKERDRAIAEANTYENKYDKLTDDIEAVRAERLALLEGADLPLPELSIENGELTYKGAKWDCMSSSEQLRVATAIVQRLRPDCGFVLIDKLEQMDVDTLNDFGTWLSERGLQAIATRVSTGDECTVIIEDGEVSGESGKKILDGNKKIDAEWFENI